LEKWFFKGYFEHTSLEYIRKQWIIQDYLNLSTGNRITISENKVYDPKDILYFTGDPEVPCRKCDKIKNNIFENNTIYNPPKEVDAMINFQQEEKGTNKK